MYEMNEDTLYYRERFEKVCNAPTKRHAIYPDQYDDSRSQELWTLWKLGIDYERQIQKVLKVYDEDKKARQDSKLADKNKKADIPEQRSNNLYALTALHKLGTTQPPVDQEDARRRHEEAIRRCVQLQQGLWDQDLTTRYYSGELITQEEYVKKAKEMGYKVRIVPRHQMYGEG